MKSTMQLTDSFDSARAPMLGAAIGDALGWPIENRSGRVGGITKVQARFGLESWRRREGGGYAPHEVAIAAGSYSDDTQLTLAVARSRLHGDYWWQHWTESELPFWLVYERGGGGASKRAAQAWNRGHAPWSAEVKDRDRARYFEAGGNGVAMRILPHILAAGDDFEAIARNVFADGICTHGHPRALLGAQLHAFALWIAMGLERALGFGELVQRALDEEHLWGMLPEHGAEVASWDEAATRDRPEFASTWKRTRDEIRDLLHKASGAIEAGSLGLDRETLEGLGAFDRRSNGAGTVAAVTALFLASRYASRPEQGLVAAAFARGADTDTIAAMTGALLGAIDRDDWMGDIVRGLQDRAYLEDLSAALSRGVAPLPADLPWRMADRRRLWEALEAAEPGGSIDLPVFGSAQVRHRETIETRSANSIMEWTLETQQGQTLYPKRVASGRRTSRVSSSPSPPTPGKGDRTPFWLVLTVADLGASRRFFSEILGLETRRDEGRNLVVVLDRILLSEGGRPRVEANFGDEQSLLEHRSAITLTRSTSDLASIHENLLTAEAPTTRILDRDGRTTFRTADPDGNVLEFRADDRD